MRVGRVKVSMYRDGLRRTDARAGFEAEGKRGCRVDESHHRSGWDCRWRYAVHGTTKRQVPKLPSEAREWIYHTTPSATKYLSTDRNFDFRL